MRGDWSAGGRAEPDLGRSSGSASSGSATAAGSREPLRGEAEVQIARGVVEEIIRPSSERWDRDAVWPEAAIRALLSRGLGGLVLPEELGGRGLGLLALTRVCETLGHADASAALCFGMHCVGAACIAAKRTDDQSKRLLQPIAAGQHVTTLALSEPGTGSHFFLPQATVRRPSSGGYVLDGSKSFVTNGGHADSYVVSATASEEAGPAGDFSLFVVPAAATGLHWQQPWAGWGMRANSSRGLEMKGVTLGVEDRLGHEGDQIWYVFSVVAPHFLVAMAGTYLGVATRALEEARGHLKRRVHAHSGKALAEVTVLQHKLGQSWAVLERTRQLCHGAARDADAKEKSSLLALCAGKAEAARAVVTLTNDCMTMVGGIAYRDGGVLQRLLRDARAADIMSPTTDILYTWMGRALLDLPLLGE